MGAHGDPYLEEPAFLGRRFTNEASAGTARDDGRRLDKYELLDRLVSDGRRDVTLGYMVMLDIVLVAAVLLYADRGAWIPVLLCAVAAVPCVVWTARRARRRVREEMEADRRRLGSG